MFRKSLLRGARKKNGQTAWNPNTGGSVNSSAGSTLSSNEALAMFYRPLPLRDTVDYEEDFYNSVMLQRECITRRGRAILSSFHDNPLVYSDTELRSGKQQIAKVVASVQGTHERDEDDPARRDIRNSISSIEKDVSFDPAAETLKSVQFLFTENRLQYCRRFVRGLRRLFEATISGTDAAGTSSSLDDPHAALEQTPLHGLMEVSAILFGAPKDEAEDYLAQFGLSRIELDAACEAQRAATETALSTIEAYNAAMKMAALSSTAPADGITSKQGGAALAKLNSNSGNNNDGQEKEGSGPSSSTSAPAITITADNVDFATTYAAYIDFASGKTATPIPSPTLGLSGPSATLANSPATAAQGLSVADRSLLSQKLRWRHLVDTLVAEDYHHLSTEDFTDMLSLSNFLHTFKFMEYKVGDCVRQIVRAKHHDFGASSQHRPDMTVDSTSGNPANRGAVERFNTD